MMTTTTTMTTFNSTASLWLSTLWTQPTLPTNTTQTPLIAITLSTTKSKPMDPLEEDMLLIDQIITVFMLLIGVPGNIVCLLVWTQHDKHNSSRIYLTSVALADLLFLLCFLVYQIQMAWGIPVLDIPAMCSSFPVLMFTFQYLSPLSTLAFTAERFISVYYPLERRVYCTVRFGKRVMVCFSCLALAISLPYGYFFTARHEVASERVICAPRLSVKEGGMMSVFSLYTTGVALFCFVVGNFTILVLNVLVIIKLCKRQTNISQLGQVTSILQKQTTLSSAAEFIRKRDRRRRVVTTSMLLSVSFLQILTTMPVSIVYVFYIQHEPETGESYKSRDEMEAAYHSYYHLHHMVVLVKGYAVLYYSTKAYVYFITSRIFRQRVKRLLLLPCLGARRGAKDSVGENT